MAFTQICIVHNLNQVGKSNLLFFIDFIYNGYKELFKEVKTCYNEKTEGMLYE